MARTRQTATRTTRKRTAKPAEQPPVETSTEPAAEPAEQPRAPEPTEQPLAPEPAAEPTEQPLAPEPPAGPAQAPAVLGAARIRIAVISDVHGNALAIEAVRKALKAARPDAVIVAGDHALNGPDPAAAIDVIRELEAAGALVLQGNTDIAVADFDYTAAFPWMADSLPDTFRIAAEWAHQAIGPERVDWLRRLPAERRLRVDDLLVLGCHASPGSQTAGFDPALDANVILERVSRTDARIVACGHTHLPDVRNLGWKMIVNAGSAGYVFDGDPTASWALITIDGDDVSAEIRRAEFDTLAVSNALSTRGLPGDVYRAATVRTGKLVR
ncbi:MAG: metallophosphoesterase family protein [Chloroflexota bacterium]